MDGGGGAPAGWGLGSTISSGGRSSLPGERPVDRKGAAADACGVGGESLDAAIRGGFPAPPSMPSVLMSPAASLWLSPDGQP